MWYLTEKLKLNNNKLGRSFDLPRKKYLILQLLLKNKNEIVTYDNIIRFADLASKGALRNHVRQLQKEMDLPIYIVAKHGVMWKEQEKDIPPSPPSKGGN